MDRSKCILMNCSNYSELIFMISCCFLSLVYEFTINRAIDKLSKTTKFLIQNNIIYENDAQRLNDWPVFPLICWNMSHLALWRRWFIRTFHRTQILRGWWRFANAQCETFLNLIPIFTTMLLFLRCRLCYSLQNKITKKEEASYWWHISTDWNREHAMECLIRAN